MMMNGPVEVGSGVDVTVEGVDQQLVLLHRKLKRIAKARGYLDVQEAEALREAQRLQLWRQFGCTSLADYMTRELGYSYRAAEDRLRVANALPALPKLTEALQTGDLNFSQARELARVATPETEEIWIDKAKDLTVREVETAVAGHTKGDLPDDAPDPRLVRTSLWLSVRRETEVLFREVRMRLQAERGEKLDDDAVLEALCRGLLSRAASRTGADNTAEVSPNRVAAAATATATVTATSNANAAVGASAAAPYRIAVTVCRDCKRGWRHGAGRVVEMSPPAVAVAECDAQRIGDLDSDDVERAHQSIPPATRRKVLHRDQQRCRVPGCASYSNLDVHHVVHREHGGTNELMNLISVCEAHHLAHHAGTLVIARDAAGELTFRREGRNTFTRATREVETRQELRRRGFDRDAIKQIMTHTVSHVGVNDVSSDQWLSIALRYAERTVTSPPT